MVVSCEEVWREISNYLEGDIEPGLHAAVEEHIRICKHCTAVMAGTKNVVTLYADERIIELPAGFDNRLRNRLEEHIRPSRGTYLGWMIAAAAALLVVGSIEVANSAPYATQELRLPHAQPGKNVPAQMVVVVSDDSKLFHTPGCRFIHDKAHERNLTASEAMQRGFTPCPRCLKKYLPDVAVFRPVTPDVGELVRYPAMAAPVH